METALSRRTVLAGLAATAAVAVLPSSPAVVEAAVVDAPAAEAAPAGWWGYSRDGADYWSGPFDSREDALAEAQADYPDEPCSTARCIPHEMEVPDLRETCVLWLSHGCTQNSLFHDISWSFEGANEDHDYEGEVSDELSRADWAPLLADLKDVFAVALFRHGRPDLIPAVVSGAKMKEPQPLVADDIDPLLIALETDDRFEAELTAVAEAWMVAQKLKDAPRRVDLLEQEDHAALEDEVAS